MPNLFFTPYNKRLLDQMDVCESSRFQFRKNYENYYGIEVER